jgi:DeoR/GlpR family transcriptional regulator of sugar metabolism
MVMTGDVVLAISNSGESDELAALLPETPLTVVTNALQTAISLTEKSEVEVYVLGGRLGGSSLSCTGWAAGQGIDQHRIDVAFFSCKGLDLAFGLSEAAEEHARVKRHVIQRASTSVLLADHTKSGISSSFFFAKNSDVDLWITDETPSQDVLDAVSSQGIRVEVAK